MSIRENLEKLRAEIGPQITLVAVSKTHSPEKIMEAYEAGQRDFGENRVQELLPKAEALPKDIRWHLIGHLQTNKVKFIAPFVHLIHSVDSVGLLAEIDKHAKKCERNICYLLQVHIAREESKFGMSLPDAEEFLVQEAHRSYHHTTLKGIMGMATLTEDQKVIQKEFAALRKLHKKHRMDILSMGMSSDWRTALECGSTMIRLGSAIFGSR